MTLPDPSLTGPMPEARLLDLVDRLGKARQNRVALQMKLSALPIRDRRDYHLRIAANTFQNTVGTDCGALVPMSNQDILFLFRVEDLTAVEEGVSRVRRLFGEDMLDPVAAAGTAEDGFVTWYDLGLEYDAFLAALRRRYDEAQRQRNELRRSGKTAIPPLDAAALGHLIDMFARADLSNFMRRQTVCRLPAQGPAVPLFAEFFISIDDLHQAIMPDRNLHANPWLFQHLTETLDRRILKFLLSDEDCTDRQDYSINLNLTSILSNEFLRFDASLTAAARGTIVVEIQPIDLVADLSAYAFARDFLHDRGYRLCIDGLTPESLALFDRHALRADLVKLIWSAETCPAAGTTRHDLLKTLVERAGPDSVMLCRVDSDQGIAFGRSLGIDQYQGRLIEKLVPSRTIPQPKHLAYR